MVEIIISDVTKRGDVAVRGLSEKFDKWSPPSLRLTAPLSLLAQADEVIE